MALFKVLRGSSDDFVTDLTRADVTLPFNDGFCYFLKDTRMFYIDYAIKDSNGNIIEKHRVPLNADDALSLTGAILNREKINPNPDEIPSSEVISTRFAEVDSNLSDLNDYCDDLDDLKMNKENPTGSGKVSINGTATGTNAVAFGGTASGEASFTSGQGTEATHKNAHAEGFNTKAYALFAHSEGVNTESSGAAAHAEGNMAKASGNASHSEGLHTEAKASASHAEGGYSIAQGDSSHAEGYQTVATHKAQHVEGEWNELDSSSHTAENRGTYVHITGIGTGETDRKNGFTVDWSGNLWGARSLAHGNNATSSGENSYAGGNTVVASGVSSHAEGSNNEAKGASSHTEGDSTYASGSYAHAEGNGSRATSLAAHAEGQTTKASGYYSHAEGYKTVAEGEESHAEGGYTTASGENSHAQNLYTIANGDAQTAMGKFNVADTTSLLIIGNGTADDARSNAFTVSESGIVYAQNRLNIAGLDLEQDAAKYTLFVNGPAFFSGTVKAAEPIEANDLTTKNYVDNNLPRMTHSWITATAGQSVFNFTTPDTGCPKVTDLANYYYVYFNGLLLIPGLHYTVSGATVTFVGWAAEAGDVCHVTGFKPISPAS